MIIILGPGPIPPLAALRLAEAVMELRVVAITANEAAVALQAAVNEVYRIELRPMDEFPTSPIKFRAQRHPRPRNVPVPGRGKRQRRIYNKQMDSKSGWVKR